MGRLKKGWISGNKELPPLRKKVKVLTDSGNELIAWRPFPGHSLFFMTVTKNKEVWAGNVIGWKEL